MGYAQRLDSMFGKTKAPGGKATSLIADDGEEIDETPYLVGSAPFTDKVNDKERKLVVTPSAPDNASDPFSGDAFSSSLDSSSGSSLDSMSDTMMQASNDQQGLSKMLDPLRSLTGPNMSTLSRFGLPNVGGMNEGEIRATLRKILRKIK